MALVIKRIAYDGGVYGVALWHGMPIGVTWERQQTLLPGDHEAVRVWNAGLQLEMWRVDGVQIERDPGNGIMLGERFNFLKPREPVISGWDSFSRLMMVSSEYDRMLVTVLNF